MSLSPSIGSSLCAAATASAAVSVDGIGVGGGIVGCVSVSYRLINNLVFIHDRALFRSLLWQRLATCLSHFSAVSIFRNICICTVHVCICIHICRFAAHAQRSY